MKKLQAYSKWNEEHSRTLQGPKNGELRNFSEYVSSEYGKYHFSDEDNQHAHQVERRPRNTVQAFVKIPRDEALSNDSEMTNYNMNLTKGYEYNPDEGTEDYKNFHKGVHPSCPNKENAYTHPKNRMFKDIFSKQTGMGVNVENEFSLVNRANTRCFNLVKDSNEFIVNEDNFMEDMHCSNENTFIVFQKNVTPSYESNQSSQFCNKENGDISNTHFQDMPKSTVHISEERTNCHTNNMHGSFCKAAFSDDSVLHETTGFSMFKLTDLLYYNANLMQDKQLLEYALVVKTKILEKIDKFRYPEKDELEFLCEITDGDQSEKNQRIITTRACRIIRNIVETFPDMLYILETPPPSQVLVYQTVPTLHDITNSCNYDLQVKNSEMRVSAVDYNLTSGSFIAQMNECIISKDISDSFDNNSYDYRSNCEKPNLNPNIPENNSINISLKAEKNIVNEESCEHNNLLPVKSEKCIPVHKLSHNYRSNCQKPNLNPNIPKNNYINSSLKTGKEISSEEFCEQNHPPPVKPEEYIPVHKFSFNMQNSVFINYELDYLLSCDICAMHGDLVFDYAFSMKQKILDKIDCFPEPYKEKLKFLCEITDGTQREPNQKSINERMCDLIKDHKHEEEKEEKIRKNLLDKQSKNACSSRSPDEDKIGHAQNFSDRQSRNMYSSNLHHEDRHEYRQNLDKQSKNMHPKQSYYEDEMINRQRQSFSSGESRRSHYKDEDHDHKQNFGGHGQPKNVHPRKPYYTDARR